MRKVQNKSLRRLKKIQTTANAQNGGQSKDMMLSVRFFNAYRFDDPADKKPRPLLVVGNKAIVKKIADDLVERDHAKEKRAKDDKPVKDAAKGYLFWNEAETTFHFLVKGPVKLPLLKSVLKRAGLRDKVHLGFASDDDDARAAESEKQVETLNGALGDEEPDEPLPEIGDDEEEGGDEEAAEGEPTAQAPPPPPPGPQPKAETQAPPVPPPPGSDAARFKQRVDELSPTVKAALQNKEAAAKEAGLAFSEAQVFGRKQEFDKAFELLDRAAGLLKPAGPQAPSAEERAKFVEKLTALTPRIKEALASNGAAGELETLRGEAQSLGSKMLYGEALKRLERIEGLLNGAAAGTGMAAWKAAREDAIKQLRALSKAVADTKDPDAAPVILQFQSIIKNLTPEPTPQGVAELRRYLETDDVITAAEEVPPEIGTLRIREPLLNGLAALSS